VKKKTRNFFFSHHKNFLSSILIGFKIYFTSEKKNMASNLSLEQLLAATSSSSSDNATTSKTEKPPSGFQKFISSKAALYGFLGLAVSALIVFVLYRTRVFGLWTGGWKIIQDPSTITCRPGLQPSCTVERVVTCPSGNCSGKAPSLDGPVRVICSPDLEQQMCTPGEWIPGPAANATCVDAQTGAPLSCTGTSNLYGDYASGSGVYSANDWICSTKLCLTPKPNVPVPQDGIPCSTTPCTQWQSAWQKCHNDTNNLKQCVQYTDPSKPSVCMPGAPCIGLPPTTRPCTQCYAVGDWSNTCTIGCEDGDIICAANKLPPLANRIQRLVSRSVTCQNDKTGASCDPQSKPSATALCSSFPKLQNTNIVQFYSTTNNSYIGKPSGGVYNWLGQVVQATQTASNALVFLAWDTRTPPISGVSYTMWLQESTTGLFLGVDPSTSNVCLVDRSARQAWTVDPAQSVLYTPSYQVLQSNGGSTWSLTNSMNSTDRWLVLPNLIFPLPVLT
jgi:hypothetical protein